MTSESDQYDYELELDDTIDKLEFGKYNGLTPVEVLSLDPSYIVWAHRTISNRWIGSQDVIASAYKALKLSEPVAQGQIVHKQRATVQAFESAMLNAFGEFPTPYWKTQR